MDDIAIKQSQKVPNKLSKIDERNVESMIEKITDAAIGLLLNGVNEKLRSAKENYEWKQLFKDTGNFFIESPDKLISFENDLFNLFSIDNMDKISRRLKDKRGYELPQLLHNEIYGLMMQYEVPIIEAESYTHHFIQIIINHLQGNDENKSLELYLGEWRREEENNFISIERKFNTIIDIIEDLKKIKVLSYSMADIDAQIRKESLYKGMSLDYFQIDDEQFESQFQAEIKNERIFVVGISREETTYRILNELNNKYSERNIIVIKSEVEWKRLEQSQLIGSILIPFFYAESIVAIPNNTNIFVYGEDEPCYSNNKLTLRRRTKANIIQSLEAIGLDSNEAYKLVEKTHGLFAPMKKKLFGITLHRNPVWMKRHSGAVMAALLCGKWTESDGDILIFEEISGERYGDSKKELEEYMHIEDPYIVEIKGHRGCNTQLASVEDAWEELDKFISDEYWDKFIKLLYEVLIESEPIFDYPFEKHFEASIYAKKPDWSPSLKFGMIRTLIMYADYRGHVEYQRQIDDVVKRILETITTKERWGYISQYIMDLCEASPKAVIQKFENEITYPTGLTELFGVNNGDIISDRHYYTNILWAIEQLIQQKMYVTRAIRWLWTMNEYKNKYSYSNSPQSVLEVIFCAWINVCALSVDDKISMARDAVEKYSTAWDVISSKLPSGRSTVCSTLNSPKYRRIDEPDILYVNEVKKTYIEYLWICVNSTNSNVDKWIKIIDHLQHYAKEIQNEVHDILVAECKNMSNIDKVKIKNKIRYLIYRHRYFVDADWSMEEKQLNNYENLLLQIKMEEVEYDFLYLFTSKYEFPLLHPIPYKREESNGKIREKNEALRHEEIKNQIAKFKDDSCLIEKLIKLAVKETSSILGEVLGEFYCIGIYDEEVMRLLLKYDKDGRHVFDYIRTILRIGSVNLKNVIIEVKEKCDNINLISNLISLQRIENLDTCIIANESEEIKRMYWSRSFRFIIEEKADIKIYLWALDECAKYGTIESYLELLYETKEKIDKNQLYKYIFMIQSMQSGHNNSMTDYYLKEILKLLQDHFIDDFKKCQKIAYLEWMCRNILEWDQMKCMQYMMKEDPTIYAELVKIIYKSDIDGDKVDEEKSKLANKIYSGFYKAKFCPTEKNGTVSYALLKEWVSKLKKILGDQGQANLFGNLVGNLLAYSPIDKDGYMPCEAVRSVIEEYYSDSLKNAYIIAEENKRGVYISDAGKSEIILSKKYKDNAEALQAKYPHVAEIYLELSNAYKLQADWERRHAEDEW